MLQECLSKYYFKRLKRSNAYAPIIHRSFPRISGTCCKRINLMELFLRNYVEASVRLIYWYYYCELISKSGRMKRLIISNLVLLLFVVTLTSCATSRKSRDELKGLMLLDNIQLSRNKAFYSRHNMKTKNEAFRKYRKNSRYL